MKKGIIIFLLFFPATFLKAQLADGSTAPDFTLTDINGNTQNLYSYLDAGKTVYLDIFAAHCPTCWAYHNTHAVRDLFNAHGPSGTSSQDIMVIAVEHDPANGIGELSGVSGVTAGDWLTGTPYPIINPEGIDRSNFITAFDAVYYPMIYAICPDKKITLIGTQTATLLYDHVGNCAITGIDEVALNDPQIYVDQYSGKINLKHGSMLSQFTLDLFDVSGKQILSREINESGISINYLQTGIYLYVLKDNYGNQFSGKFFR